MSFDVIDDQTVQRGEIGEERRRDRRGGEMRGKEQRLEERIEKREKYIKRREGETKRREEEKEK